jgi:DnaJ-class molecular chaperone
MPSIINDYKDIASRMKGELKPVKKVCEKCNGTGWINVDKSWFTVNEPCECLGDKNDRT